MQKIVRKLFGLHLGDGAQALQFTKFVTLWAFGNTCFDTITDGLFLDNIGANQFPRVYFCIAIAMLGTAAFVLKALRRASAYKVLIGSLGVGVVMCASAAFLIHTNPSDVFWYSLKILSRMFFIVLIPLTWTFTDQYHDLQDAKRMYAIYNAAYYIGAILSGLFINFFLEIVGTSSLMLLASFSLLWSMKEARNIALHTQAVHDDSTEGVFSTSKRSFLSTCKLLIQSRFVIFMLLMTLTTQVMLTVTEFNYMDVFDNAFKGKGEGDVTEFLGKCRAFISFFNILVGMFVYNRFVRRSGLNNAIMLAPIFFLMLYGGWIFSNTLPLAVLGLVAIEGVLYTFDDNNINLMTNLVPTKLRPKVRIFIGSFFEPAGMLISSTLLFAFQEYNITLGLILTLLACSFALIVRSIYASAIISNLKENALHFERKLKTWISSMSKKEQIDAKKQMLQALNSPTEEIQLLGAKSLIEGEDVKELEKIFLAAKSFGTSAKIKLLKILDKSSFKEDPLVLQEIGEWISSTNSPALAKHAKFFLAKCGSFQSEVSADELESEDLLVKGAAILSLTHPSQSLNYANLNKSVASKKLEQMLESKSIDEISMALELIAEEGEPESAKRAFAFLNHPSLLVKKTAAKTIGRCANASIHRYAPKLIVGLEQTRDSSLRLLLLDGLGKISDPATVKDLLLVSVHFRPAERRRCEEVIGQIGEEVTHDLLTLTKDVSFPERARILSGKILARLALAELQANLPDILDIEIDRAYFYFYFAHTIQKQYPLYDLSTLKNALLSGYQSVIDFIIHLLGAAGSLEDSSLLVHALHSRNEKMRANAVESLERTCNAKIFNSIAPLVDDLPLEEKMAACLDWHGDFPKLSLSELLDQLDDSPILFDKIVAVRLKTKLETPNWREELRELMKNSKGTFYQYANELLENEKPN